jgi:branched-chain amino acid transport system substrate-binding protein
MSPKAFESSPARWLGMPIRFAPIVARTIIIGMTALLLGTTPGISATADVSHVAAPAKLSLTIGVTPTIAPEPAGAVDAGTPNEAMPLSAGTTAVHIGPVTTSTNPPPAVEAAAPKPAPAPAPVVAAVVRHIQGVSEHEIRFGMAAPFTGPAKELGHQMQVGIESAFKTVDATGGIFGRQLTLSTANDGYDPSKTADAMKQLYEKDKIFGIIGNVGTPTAVVSLPYALSHRMLFFGAFTGAGLLRRDPPDRYVFNYRASYAEETYAVVRYLVKVRRIQPDQIAVFAQHDGYGDAGFAGVAKAMRSLNASGDSGAIMRLNYERNTVNVDEAIAQLQQHQRLRNTPPIKAVVMVATYRAAAKFIEKTHDQIPGLIYTNVSFVGSTSLADELMVLGPKFASGVIVTQVVPAVDSYASVVLDYKAALAKFFPDEEPDYVSFEGYLSAKLLIEGLKRTGQDLDTEKLVAALEGMHNFDMGVGPHINFSGDEHQALHKVWGSQLNSSGHYGSIDLE